MSLLRIILGSLFVFSGILKWIDIPAFLIDLRSYSFLSIEIIRLLAATLPVVEVFLGIMMIINYKSSWAAICLTIMISVFTIAIIWILYSGNKVSCGCFGSNKSPISWWSVIRNLSIISLLILWWHVKRNKQQNVKENSNEKK